MSATTPVKTNGSSPSSSTVKTHANLSGSPSNAPKQKVTKSPYPKVSIPFDWDEYLKRIPAEVAPPEAFMQSPTTIVNKFEVGMRLEARDPKKNDPTSWSLASVVSVDHGSQRIRLRFDGSDSMSDIFELINSTNIKPLFSDDVLYPPMAYRGNIATYPTFVKKILERPDVVVAPQDCFQEVPPKPLRNLFKRGQKLEAIDRKNPHLIYPATVQSVAGDEVRISFDGWKGSFDYSCVYYSRELFPVNWCRDTKHPILPPRGWDELVQGKTDSLSPVKPPTPRPSSRTGRENLNNKDNSVTTTQKQTPPTLSPPVIKLKLKHTPKRQPGKLMNKVVDEITQRNHPNESRMTMKKDEEHDADPFFDDSPLPAGVNRFQCQRAIPYDQWLELKQRQRNNGNKMTTSTVSQQNAIALKSGSSESTDVTNKTSALSEPVKSEINGGNMSNQPQPVKKIKIDSDSFTDHNSSVQSDQTNNNYVSTVENWTVAQVSDYINSCPSLAKYSDIFAEHEINGQAFLLLTTDIMVRYMGLKIGPVLKINDLIERAKQL